jgi:hypothetical protein
MPERIVHPEQELHDAASHVNYELEMLYYASQFLGQTHSSPRTTLPKQFQNMALECLLLHFRSLRAFLCPSLQPVQADDILASDFLDERVHRDLGDSSKLVPDKKRIDKMFAHLSYSREQFITGGQFAWEARTMVLTMLQQFSGFQAQLPAERAQWFLTAKIVEDWCSEISEKQATQVL